MTLAASPAAATARPHPLKALPAASRTQVREGARDSATVAGSAAHGGHAPRSHTPAARVPVKASPAPPPAAAHAPEDDAACVAAAPATAPGSQVPSAVGRITAGIPRGQAPLVASHRPCSRRPAASAAPPPRVAELAAEPGSGAAHAVLHAHAAARPNAGAAAAPRAAAVSPGEPGVPTAARPTGAPAASPGSAVTAGPAHRQDEAEIVAAEGAAGRPRPTAAHSPSIRGPGDEAGASQPPPPPAQSAPARGGGVGGARGVTMAPAPREAGGLAAGRSGGSQTQQQPVRAWPPCFAMCAPPASMSPNHGAH